MCGSPSRRRSFGTPPITASVPRTSLSIRWSMPIGAIGTAGRQVFALLRRLNEELGVNTTCGASNVSFGLPNRNALNGAFLSMAIASGMTSAITSPLHDEVRAAVMAADVMMGNDQDCAAWIASFREQPAGGAGGRRGGREGRRRAATEAGEVSPPS